MQWHRVFLAQWPCYVWCMPPHVNFLSFFPTSLCGVLVFDSLSRASSSSSSSSSSRPASFTQLVTHNFVTHNFVIHNFVTHNLSPTTLSHTTCCHPQLCHTQLVTWQAWHLATTTFVLRGRRGTWRHPPAFCVAGVAPMALGWLWWRVWAGYCYCYSYCYCYCCCCY